MKLRECLPFFLVLWCLPSSAVTIRVTPAVLQRTLEQQLFSGQDHRYFVRGKPGSACYLFAEHPEVSFRGQRIVVHVHAQGRLGSAVAGMCFGVGLQTEADVTLTPVADGERISFRDARIENLSAPADLGPLLSPFLSRKLPQQMTFDAGALLRRALSASQQRTGCQVLLPELQIRSIQIEPDALTVDAEGTFDVQ